MQRPYIDIHTHQHYPMGDNAVISIQNIALNHHEILSEQPCSVGLHPWYVHDDSLSLLQHMQSILHQSNVMAVGECGLDKHVEVPFALQQYVFEQQIALAARFQKPLLIHCVRAFQEVVQTLDRTAFKQGVIFHGYRKNWTLAQQLLASGYYLSIGAHCLNGSQDQVLKNIPLTQLFLETDTSAAATVEAIYQYVATVRSIPLDALKEAIYRNYKTLFNK